jgi:aminoglycoside 3'-phosphotransferase-2
MGVRVPEVVRQFDSRDSFAMTMATLGGRSAEHARARDETAVVRAIALAFAALHALPIGACPFDETLTVRLARAHDHIRQGAIDATQFDARNAGVTPEALYRRLEASVPTQEDCVVAHGDATLSNLIVGNDGEIGFIDCGQLRQGRPLCRSCALGRRACGSIRRRRVRHFFACIRQPSMG